MFVEGRVLIKEGLMHRYCHAEDDLDNYGSDPSEVCCGCAGAACCHHKSPRGMTILGCLVPTLNSNLETDNCDIQQGAITWGKWTEKSGNLQHVVMTWLNDGWLKIWNGTGMGS